MTNKTVKEGLDAKAPASNIGLAIAVKYLKGAPGVYLAKEISDAITAERKAALSALPHAGVSGYELAKIALREAGRPTTFDRVERMRAALEAALSSQHAEAVPVAEDLRAEVLRLFKANGMESDERLAILIANYFATRSPAPAPAGVPAIKALEWNERGFAHTDTGIAYRVEKEPGYWRLTKLEGASTLYSGYPTEREAKAAAQADYEARVRSALHPAPTPVSAPVGVTRPQFLSTEDGEFNGNARGEGEAATPVGMVEIHVVFQDDVGAANLRFVEVETLDRKSVSVGTWMKRDDGYDVLALSVHPSDIWRAK